MAGLMDMIGQPTNIWGMINRLPSLFSQQETPQKRDFSFAKDFIQQPGVEGRRNEYYWDENAFDGEGAVTSGVGHLVPGTKGMSNHHLLGQPIQSEDVDKQYEKDLQKHGNAGRDFFGRKTFDKLPENVQTVLTSLVFNVGPDGIKKYTRMKEAVENFDKESFVDNKGNLRDGGIAGISEELIYTNYSENPNKTSPRFKQTGDRTGMEMMHLLNPSPTRKPMSTLEPIAPTPQQQYEAARINRPPLTPPPRQPKQIAVKPPEAYQKQIAVKPPEAYMANRPQQPSLQQIAQTAQVQPALNPFPWLKEVSGSYSYPSPPPNKRWV